MPNSVGSALKVRLLGPGVAKIERGGTRNPAAFDAYLRASKAFSTAHDAGDYQAVIIAYTEAIGLDANYALAFAARSIALSSASEQFGTLPALHGALEKARADAQRAIALTPELADGHLALALFFDDSLDFMRANAEYERAVA